jgi:hypothetical protein
MLKKPPWQGVIHWMRTLSRIVVVLGMAALSPAMMAARVRRTHAGHHSENGTHAAHEDSTFFEGKPFEHPAPVSPEVLRVLVKSDAAKDILDSAAESGQADTGQLFRAREVHLGRGKDVDLVVIGRPPKPGLDPDWFWVVRSAQRNPQVVLYAGSSTLKLLESRTNGYRDIVMISPLASRTRCVTYHFDGNRYDVSQEKWADSAGPPGTGCEGR